jgi:hypothetical protein
VIGSHPGETATIVGGGPSLLSLTADDFGPGPVITINDVIVIVRRLGLPNPIYTMQKDGCIPHDSKRMVVKGRGRPVRLPLGCICPQRGFIPPRLPETVLLSAAESSRCFRDYPRRHVIDVEAEFGVRWHTPSAPVAVRVAHLMGCTGLRMLGHDAFTSGDDRRVYGDDIGIGMSAYWKCGDMADRAAKELGMAIEWRAIVPAIEETPTQRPLAVPSG